MRASRDRFRTCLDGLGLLNVGLLAMASLAALTEIAEAQAATMPHGQ